METPLPQFALQPVRIVALCFDALNLCVFKTHAFVNVREGSVKISVKLCVKLFKKHAFVKVREGTVKLPVK